MSMRALLISCLLIPSSWSQEPPPGRPNFIRFHPVLSALDKDADGTISSSELKAAPTALASLDGNKDGKLTRDEMRPAGFGRPGGREGRGPGGPGESRPPDSSELVKTLMSFDADGDGKLTKSEMPERMQGLFDRADTNKDGVLTQDELTRHASAQPARAPEREGGRGGRPPMRMDPGMAALDADQDGEVSAAEIRNSATTLKTLDRNGDGQITEDEVRPNFGGRR